MEEASFWRLVDRSGGSDACWPWTAGKSSTGYGAVFWNSKTVGAHRVAWEVENGEELGERLACHRCDNPICCNPRHIYAGTPQQNAMDAVIRGRWSKKGFEPGTDHSQATLADDDVKQVFEMARSGMHVGDIAKQIGRSSSLVSMILSGHRWAHLKPKDIKIPTPKAMKGASNGNARWTEDHARTVKRLSSRGLGPTDISRRIGMPYTTVRHIIIGKIWAHVTP